MVKGFYLLFPSPLRGLIFHSGKKTTPGGLKLVSVPSSGTYLPFKCSPFVAMLQKQVSVPSSGTYLPFYDGVFECCAVGSFRPLFGDLSSILKNQSLRQHLRLGFRPLFGDLSSIPNLPKMLQNSWTMFPSPLRGLIFHSEFATMEAKRMIGFRPLFGDLSSIRNFSK